MRTTALPLIALLLAACPKSPERTEAVPTQKPSPKPAMKPIAAAEVKPPLIDRTHVIKLERVERPDGSGVWMTVGAPVAATGHYANDAPKSAKPGEVTLTFMRESQGDYPHLLFEDAQKRKYDFGAANNQIEKSGFDIEDKSVLVGKSFVVKWDFRPTTFACCEGETTSWVGMKPTIIEIRSMVEAVE